jgi:hypothetical protein
VAEVGIPISCATSSESINFFSKIECEWISSRVLPCVVLINARSSSLDVGISESEHVVTGVHIPTTAAGVSGVETGLTVDGKSVTPWSGRDVNARSGRDTTKELRSGVV